MVKVLVKSEGLRTEKPVSEGRRRRISQLKQKSNFSLPLFLFYLNPQWTRWSNPALLRVIFMHSINSNVCFYPTFQVWHNLASACCHFFDLILLTTVFPDFLFFPPHCRCGWSVAKLCPTLWLTGCSTPGFPVLHYLLKFAQTHVHWLGDAIQPSHPLSPTSPALNLSQHQSFPMSQFFTSSGQRLGLQL